MRPRRLAPPMGWAALLLVLAVAGPAGAEDGGVGDNEIVVKQEGPHRLLLPRDWPVEHKDGYIAPVPIETYLSMKFQQVGDALERLDRRLAALDARLQAAEAAQHGQGLRIKLLEEQNQGGN